MTKLLVMWSNFLCQALSFNDKLLQICKVEQFVIGSHYKIGPHCPASFVNFTGRGKAGFLRGGAVCFSAGRPSLVSIGKNPEGGAV